MVMFCGMKTLLVSLVVLAIISGCKPRKLGEKPTRSPITTKVKTGDDTVLAVIGTRQITLGEIQRTRDKMPVIQRLMFSGKKGLRRLVEAYIEFLVMAMEGEKQGLASDPLVMEALRRFTAMAYLKKRIEKETEHVKFTDAQVRKYYETHKQYFHIPERHRCLDIKISDEDKAKKVYNRLSVAINETDKGPLKIFQEFVKRYSEAPDKDKTGGDTGLLPPLFDGDKKVAPEVITHALSMKVVFAISEPFKASDGFHILLLKEIKPQIDMDLNTAKPRIRNRLRKDLQEKVGRKFVNSLMSQAKVEIDEKVLDEIE